MAINNPVPFIKVIKFGGVVAPGLSKLGQKVLKNLKKKHRIAQIRINQLINRETNLTGFFSDMGRYPPPVR